MNLYAFNRDALFKKQLLKKMILIMRMIIIIMTTCLMQVSAASFAQKINLVRKNISLATMLDQISKQSGYQVLYSSEKIDINKRMDVDFRNTDLKEVLETCLIKQGFSYAIEDNVIMIKKKEPSFLDHLIAKFIDVDAKGKVLDAKGEPLEGATVLIKGTNRTIKTNAKGEFLISKIPEDAVLVIRYVGYKTLEIPLKGVVLPLEIRLDVETGELEEVKVSYSTGYQVVPKERATGSFEFISGEELNRRTGSDILSRLEGVTTSVMFDRRGTSPNDTRMALSNVNIRGLSTLSAGMKSPLVVVDNFPYEGDVNNINPNDVENISILKDAAAASIWGARAANGVIVITTKKGRFNQPVKFSFNTNLNVVEKPDLFHFPVMSSSDFIDVETFLFDKGFYNAVINNVQRPALSQVTEILLARRSKQISSADSAAQIDALRKQDVRHDFEKYIYQTAVNQQYALNINGGSDKISYTLSAGLDKNPSILKRDRFKRITLNSDNTYAVLKNLELRIGLRYSSSEAQRNSTGNYGASNYNFRSNQRMPLYTRLADDNGNYLNYAKAYREVFTDTVGGGNLLSWKYSPLQELDLVDDKTKLQEFVINTVLAYKITRYLNLEANYQYLYSNSARAINKTVASYSTRDLINQFTNLKSTVANIRNPIPIGGILDDTENKTMAHQGRLQLNLNRNFNEAHQINGLFGAEIRETIRRGDGIRNFGYNDDKLSTIPVDYVTRFPRYGNLSAAQIPVGLSRFSKNTDHFVSLFANAAYTYANRYTLSGSARRDAANQFGVKVNDQWKPFWSAGLSWNITQEPFFKVRGISYLRVRATYGYQGNVNNTLSPYTILSFVAASSLTNGLPYSSISSPASPGLSWETIKQKNAALEFGLLDSRITGSIDVYHKKSDNLILAGPVDATTGVARVARNSAGMSGKGVDFSLNTINLNRGLRWSSEFNFSQVSNKVTKVLGNGLLPGAEDMVSGEGAVIDPRVGITPYAIFSYKWAGLDPVTGDPRGYLGKVPSKDYVALSIQRSDTASIIYHGSAIPKVFGTFNNAFNYKGISLLVSISYQLGYYFRKNALSYAMLYNGATTHPDFAKRWKQPGDENTTTIPSQIYPVSNPNRDVFYSYTEVNILKGDNIRLEFVRLGYDLNKSIASKLLLNNAQLFVSVNNLGLLWAANKDKIDPKYDYGNSRYPNPKAVAFGLKLDF